ncbi:DNA topoisomerase 2-binding protein 1 [Pseudolycoriella hygida]|uniref:DNA topoisomerase 2-binding protein 1 n=1 Tax=Pseudolycoriella hygida TaxID=35572 RepID=A0A9Q0N638_9DIPT|nr:DNA topoisomerase 2-binding protein 1 [Pseudolycoriella hygida]
MASQRITDLMQSTACESEIKFYFVTKSGSIDEASEDLKYSFQIIADFSSCTENLLWVSEANCLKFDVSSLSKENIFVLEEFEGDAFQHLALTKAIVLGPRVVISCQLTDDAVPNIASPIYTLALKNAVVCLSGLSAERRAEIHKLVGFMGGLWTKDLTESTTHLITNTVTTAKYECARGEDLELIKSINKLN